MADLLRSFIDVPTDSHFAVQNLPVGVFKPAQGAARVGVAIGDLVLDLSVLEEEGKFRAAGFPKDGIFAADSLNAFLSLGRPAWQKTRAIIQHLLAAETAELRDNAGLRERAFHQQKSVTMQLPARIG